MATFDKYIYEARLRIRQLNLYDDDKLDDRLIKDWIKNQRSLWIRNEMNKPRSVDEQIIQTLGCVALEVADRTSCPTGLTGYSILQTVEDIPNLIELNNGDGIIEVGPVDRIARPFSYITLSRARFSGNGKWNSRIIFAFRYGTKILLIAKDMESGSFLKYIRYIRVRGVFVDPEEVANFTHVDGTPCYSDTDDYPLNEWMWNYIRDQITKDNFELITTAPTDKVNDSTESLKVSANEE
jgi:hypothetical protein